MYPMLAQSSLDGAQFHRKGGVVFESMAVSYSTPAMNDLNLQSIAPPGVMEPPKIRTEFPETWLWEDFDVNK